MLTILTALPAFLTAHWADLLALGAAMTAVSQFIGWLSRKFPNSSALARLVNVSNIVMADYFKLLAELAGIFNVGPRAKDKPPSIPPTTHITILFLVLPMIGCSSFLHWSPSAVPDVAVLCAIANDTGLEAKLAAIAAEYGVPLVFVELAYQSACNTTAAASPSTAKESGLSGARAAAMSAHRMGATFKPPAGDGGTDPLEKRTP